jgi:hypothetical protein
MAITAHRFPTHSPPTITQWRYWGDGRLIDEPACYNFRGDAGTSSVDECELFSTCRYRFVPTQYDSFWAFNEHLTSCRSSIHKLCVRPCRSRADYRHHGQRHGKKQRRAHYVLQLLHGLLLVISSFARRDR